MQQIKLKDEDESDQLHMCPAKNHSKTITVFLTVAYLQFFRSERVAQSVVGPSSVALRMAEPVSSFITIF